MLSDSVYNYATTRRGTGDQDSDSQYEGQAQLQITSIQKPRNKRKNFKPISSRMVEVSDESEKEDDELDGAMEESSSEILEYERKTMLLPAEDRSKQRLNNNEVSPMDLSVATRPPSSEADDDSGDSLRHKFILEQLRSQKLYSPGTEVSLSLSLFLYLYMYVSVWLLLFVYAGQESELGIVGEEWRKRCPGRGLGTAGRHPVRGRAGAGRGRRGRVRGEETVRGDEGVRGVDYAGVVGYLRADGRRIGQVCEQAATADLLESPDFGPSASR